jgi:hypothetical protein
LAKSTTKIRKNNAVSLFLAFVLIAGTISLLPSPFLMRDAQAAPFDYEMDKYKSKDSKIDEKINCNNIDINVNGFELDALPPFFRDLSKFAGDSKGKNNEYSDQHKDFFFACINKNNNHNNEDGVDNPNIPDPDDNQDCPTNYSPDSTSGQCVADPICPTDPSLGEGKYNPETKFCEYQDSEDAECQTAGYNGPNEQGVCTGPAPTEEKSCPPDYNPGGGADECQAVVRATAQCPDSPNPIREEIAGVNKRCITTESCPTDYTDPDNDGICTGPPPTEQAICPTSGEEATGQTCPLIETKDPQCPSANPQTPTFNPDTNQCEADPL